MPRLSVDLDLVFVDHDLLRDEALARINAGIRAAGDRLAARGFQVQLLATPAGEIKLLVRQGLHQVKIEVNTVMRGVVRPVRRASLVRNARDVLMADLEIPIVSLEDVYGGKLVAALDRQHPRDLFDVMHLFANEGITPEIRRAFIVYLASSNRPLHEVLFPPLRDIRRDFEFNFQGMTAEPVSLASLLEARNRLLCELQQSLDKDEREFLLSLVAGSPDWARLGVDHVERLPGVRWKLQNLLQLKKSNSRKFVEQADQLAARFKAAPTRVDRT